MDQVILALLILSAVCFAIGSLSRFLKFQIMGHEPTIWWRGSMSLLGFSIALMMWQLLHLPPAR